MCRAFCFWAGMGVLLEGQVADHTPPFAPMTGGDEINWRQVTDDYQARFAHPTDPVEIGKLALPWDPVQAVVVVIPLEEWNSDASLARLVRDLLAALLAQGSVVGLFHENDYRLLADWLSEMETDPGIAPHLERLELVACETRSLWVRDFAPVFGRTKSGRLAAVDSSFLPSRRLMNNLQNAKVQMDPWAQYLDLREATVELKDRRGSDLVSASLVPFIEARWGVPTALSRPPLYLLGGDFLLVDEKTALVSAETLAENGSGSEALGRTLQQYYGIEHVWVMENLPGDTIEHLDFVLQPMGADVILVASPPERFGSDRVYHRYLERELRNRLRRNYERLTALFPDHRLIEVPMLPPLLDDEATVVNELLAHCIQQIALERDLPFWGPWDPKNPLNEEALGGRLKGAIQNEMRLYDWNDPVARGKAVASYLNRPLEALIERHVEEHVRYRSYINSLLVRKADGNNQVLVPRFRPSGAEEVALVERLERETEAAYQKALPGVELVWIDCTDLTDSLGAVHCLTATLPDPEAMEIDTLAE